MCYLFPTDNVCNDEVDYGESENTDNKTDEAIKDGILCFLDFASVTRGSHVVNATDNHYDDADKTEYADDAVDNADNVALKIGVATIGAKSSVIPIGRGRN